MLNNILNLDGVTVLDKKQQKSFKGGETCRFTVIRPSGNVQSGSFEVGVDGPEASNVANDACVDAIESGEATRCFYDCEHDGFGQ